MLTEAGHQVDLAAEGEAALGMIREKAYDVVITDMKMPSMDGMTLFREVRACQIQCPFIFITAFATIDSAVEAMRQGATDYITKPFEEERLLMTVERALGISRIIKENRELKQELQETAGSDEIIYSSRPMKDLMEMAAQVARRDTAVLIRGESGTGKELVARFIHKNSPRASERFVPVNCAAISPSLVESELFGYEKGAFTGADKKAKGKFEYASDGTLFLDEIGDMPLEAQSKLLRTLEEKSVQRVGGNNEIPVNVRIVCATNQNLEALVEQKDFRRDLFYRINVFPIHVPPLRERMEDVIPIAEYSLKRLGEGKDVQLTEGAKRILCRYSWPGNVRELVNAMERAIILCRKDGVVTAETLSFLGANGESNGDGDICLPPEGICLEELESAFVRQALEATQQNQSAAAKLLGLTRAKFRVLMKQAGIK
jgi:DNA-binding NtrC family response regulator